MMSYLSRANVLLKDFAAFAGGWTERVRAAAHQLADQSGRPLTCLHGSSQRKELLARDRARRDGLASGLIGIWSVVEPCLTHFVRKDREQKKLVLRLEPGKCLHCCFYFLHEQLGLLHLRLQTWFPFAMNVCLNGRHWLARQLDQHGVGCVQRENCFTWVEDAARAQALARLYPALIRQGIQHFGSTGVLRVETTMNRPHEFRVCRASERDPERKKQWQVLRKSVGDLHRRAEICEAANGRYLEALAGVRAGTSAGEAARRVCQPVEKDGRRHRGLNPWAKEDGALLEVISRGEWTVAGFRHRDVRAALHPVQAGADEQRRRSGRITRALARLRAHGVIRKVSGTHRYQVTAAGRPSLTALLAARQADVEKLIALAA